MLSVKDSHLFFCMPVGFVGTYSEACIEPEDAGSGEGRDVSGWARCRHDLRKGMDKVSATRGKRGAGRGKR